jgi:hypothetical protein
MASFLENALIASLIIFLLAALWIGAQECARRYKKNHPEPVVECEKEIGDCLSCGLKEKCKRE